MNDRLQLTLYKIIACFLFPFLTASCLASGPPKGYLVPTPASIPPGFTQMEIPYFPYSTDGYVLQYSTADHEARLIISEQVDRPYAMPKPEDNTIKFDYPAGTFDSMTNFERMTQNYSAGDRLLSAGHHVEKIADISYMGTHGALYLRDDMISHRHFRSYDLFLDDDKKLLRVQTADGPSFHFTDDIMMGVLRGLVRQD